MKNYIHFWTEFLLDTLRVANEIRNITDKELRNKISSLKIIETQEIERATQYLKANSLSKAKARKLSKNDLRRRKYEQMLRKAARSYKERVRLEDILYARLYLKNEDGIIALCISLGVLETLKLPMHPDKALIKIKEIFPE